MVWKGRTFYATLYQEVFFGNPGSGGSLNVCASTVRNWTIEFIQFNFSIAHRWRKDGCQRVHKLGLDQLICHIIIVANYISHLGIKMISWRWVVGDVTKTPEFSDQIQVNCLFFTREKYVALKTTRSSKSVFLITWYQMH